MQLLFARPLQAFQAANCLSIRSQGQLHAGASKRYATGFGALRWATIFTLEFFIVARRAYSVLAPSWPCTCVCCCKACQFRTACLMHFRPPAYSNPTACRIMFRTSAAILLALGFASAQYPLEQGIVPNDQYTAAPAAAPLGTDGWRTGRSTFFDGSDTFKNAYIARYINCLIDRKGCVFVLGLMHAMIKCAMCMLA